MLVTSIFFFTFIFPTLPGQNNLSFSVTFILSSANVFSKELKQRITLQMLTVPKNRDSSAKVISLLQWYRRCSINRYMIIQYIMRVACPNFSSSRIMASLNLKREEISSFINTERLRVKKAIEILSALEEPDPTCDIDLAQFTIEHCRWLQKFTNGRYETSQKYSSGRPISVKNESNNT